MADHNIFDYSECNLNFTEIGRYVHEDDRETLKEFIAFCRSKDALSWYASLWVNYPEYMYPNRMLRVYVSPVLLVLGTFGNIFSFIILAKNMLKVSTYSYLAVLAIMDMLVLYIGLLRMWVGQFTVDIQDTANWLCKGVNFLGYVSSDSSVWLIIAVTIERFIAVCFPLKAPRMCNTKRARMVILLVIVAICVVNAHIIWTVELRYIHNNGSYITQCDASEDHKFLVKSVWPWVDAAIYSFVPFVIITILNVLIIRQVIGARQQRNQLQQLTVMSKINGIVYKTQAKRHCEGSKKLTCMLLAVSFTFLLTTLPMNLLQIVSAFLGPKDGSEDYDMRYAKYTLARTVVELLMYINHTINFFLYCATGRKFRRQFKVMVCLCCQGKIVSFFKAGKKRSTSASFRLTKFNSVTSPRTIVIECDRKILQNGHLL